MTEQARDSTRRAPEATASEGAREPARPALLGRALIGNAVFSAVSGLVLLLATEPAAAWLGVPEVWLLRSLGGGLVAFGAGLLLLARSDRPRRGLVVAASASDFAWVAGSALLLLGFPDLLTPDGRAAVAGVAVVVAGLGGAQLVGLRRRTQV